MTRLSNGSSRLITRLYTGGDLLKPGVVVGKGGSNLNPYRGLTSNPKNAREKSVIYLDHYEQFPTLTLHSKGKILYSGVT